jgi:PAS domain S-box-containing protein
LAALAARATNMVERAAVTCLRIELYLSFDQAGRAIAVGLDYLRHLGIEWSPHPAEGEACREYDQSRSQLGRHRIEDLIKLPLMTDPESLATLDVLTKLMVPAYFTDINLTCLTVCQAVNLSLERGNSDASCIVYEYLSMVAGRFGDYQAARCFGQIGYDLVEVHGLNRFQARAYLDFAALPWTRHVKAGCDLARRGFEIANNSGELAYAAHACWLTITLRLAAGDPLAGVQREVEAGLAFAQKVRFGFAVDILTTQLGLVRTLRGLTRTFGSFDDGHFDGLQIERRFSGNPNLVRVECWYWIRKLQARFFAGDYAAAIGAESRAQPLLWTSVSSFEMAEYHFCGALSHAASCDSIAADQQAPHLEALTAHHRQLAVLAEVCPENFENRAALVGAEIARIDGRALDAEHLYEQAIYSARANGFVHNEGIASELAARFYAARGLQTIADAYLRNAQHCYRSWGAEGKVRQLDQLYPHLREEQQSPGPTSTIVSPVEQLDLATLIKVSQAVSGEIVLDKLLDTLMRTALQQAGAERGLLILARGTEQRIAAEATGDGDMVVVRLGDTPIAGAAIPESVLQYVLRTRDGVTLGDASAENPFSSDPYILEHRTRSTLCLPLLNRARLVGVLYLENNLAAGVFAPGRVAVLKLLASQAAVSQENTDLYRKLAEREARIRRLIDANIVGIFFWDFEGRILDANDAFLRIVGYDRQDLLSGRVSWTDMTPPDWRERDAQWVEEHKRTGRRTPIEKEYFRKDGSRVPILLAAANFEDSENQGVAFVLDQTERKRAEAALRDSQAQLAHANRLETMGQLTASIAHEVNQPIAATVTNAQSALRWLKREPADLEEVRQALARIVRDGVRAGDVIGRIRGLTKKASPRKDWLEVNGAIREVIDLTRGEAVRSGVSVRTDLANGLPLSHGDRVQLQQVLLNLIINAIQALSTVPEGAREVLITTSPAEPSGVLVTLQDTGPGLPSNSGERVFEPFYSTKSDGLGMGLPICRSIIEAQGGRLWAEANEPRGAVFRFTLPTHTAGSSL